jgi:hypothetical protein
VRHAIDLHRALLARFHARLVQRRRGHPHDAIAPDDRGVGLRCAVDDQRGNRAYVFGARTAQCGNRKTGRYEQQSL